MKKVFVYLTDERGKEIVFEKVPYKGGYEFHAPIEPKFCPYCGGGIKKHSPAMCSKCGKEIGLVTDGIFRVTGNPFKNWNFSPLTGLGIVEVFVERKRAGP